MKVSLFDSNKQQVSDAAPVNRSPTNRTDNTLNDVASVRPSPANATLSDLDSDTANGMAGDIPDTVDGFKQESDGHFKITPELLEYYDLKVADRSWVTAMPAGRSLTCHVNRNVTGLRRVSSRVVGSVEHHADQLQRLLRRVHSVMQ